MLPTLEETRAKIEPLIRSVLDFPKKGINFRDIMPLFAHPALVNELCVVIANHIRTHVGQVDAVAALEARGFLFGPQVAIQLGVPFVPIRKKGKLPGVTLQAVYIKEYGEDIVEMQEGAVKAGQRVYLLDDLLATGGTMKAAIELIRSAGAVVAEAFVIIELAGLKGRDKSPDVPIKALITYPDA